MPSMRFSKEIGVKRRQTSSKDANEIKLIEAAIWGDSTLQFTETLVSIVIW